MNPIEKLKEEVGVENLLCNPLINEDEITSIVQELNDILSK